MLPFQDNPQETRSVSNHSSELKPTRMELTDQARKLQEERAEAAKALLASMQRMAKQPESLFPPSRPAPTPQSSSMSVVAAPKTELDHEFPEQLNGPVGLLETMKQQQLELQRRMELQRKRMQEKHAQALKEQDSYSSYLGWIIPAAVGVGLVFGIRYAWSFFMGLRSPQGKDSSTSSQADSSPQ